MNLEGLLHNLDSTGSYRDLTEFVRSLTFKVSVFDPVTGERRLVDARIKLECGSQGNFLVVSPRPS